MKKINKQTVLKKRKIYYILNFRLKIYVSFLNNFFSNKDIFQKSFSSDNKKKKRSRDKKICFFFLVKIIALYALHC